MERTTTIALSKPQDAGALARDDFDGGPVSIDSNTHQLTCVNCDEPTKKYKCSKCLAPYCSVKCYKSHKDSTPCQELQEARKTQAPTKSHELEQEPTLYAPFSTEDTVPLEKLQQLEHCEDLKNLLYNPHLRNLLQQIDVAHNANLTMTAAMQEPLFVEFANVCLQQLEPMSESERRELELNT